MYKVADPVMWDPLLKGVSEDTFTAHRENNSIAMQDPTGFQRGC